jgi:hypothetical protein
VDVDVVVRGEREAIELVSRLARRLQDGRPALVGLVDRILYFQRERFEGRGARWRKLAPATIRKDRQEGRDPRTLVLTGALMRSLTVRGAPGQFLTITATDLRFGTRIFYARFHRAGQGVPRRAPAGLTRAQRVDIVERFRRLLTEDL